MSGPPLQLTIPWHNPQISSFPKERGAMVLSHALLQMGLRYFQFTPLNGEVSCLQQTQCQGEICSVDCGPCSSACMIHPSRSTELFPTSWQRMIKWEWEQLLPVPLHTACQSHEQVGLWDSCAFLPATGKEAGLWTSWRITEEKGKRLRNNPVHEIQMYLGWEVWDTKQSLPIDVCCLGKKAERYQFYYPMTYLSQGKYRDTSDMDHYQWNCLAPTTAGS